MSRENKELNFPTGAYLLKNIPAKINRATADKEIKQPVQKLVPRYNLEEYNPSVFISYATGRRPERDDERCGPGMFYCKALVDHFLDFGDVNTFTGLHVGLAGCHWKVFLEKLNQKVARILLVVMTPALFQSLNCFDEIHTALKNDVKIIPLVFEDSFPCPRPWPNAEDGKRRNEVYKVLTDLNAYPEFPGTVLKDPEKHLKQVFRQVNSMLQDAPILTRETLSRVTDTSGSSETGSSDSESLSSDFKPPFSIICINLRKAPLKLRGDGNWKRFLEEQSNILKSNLKAMCGIANKIPIEERNTVNPLRDLSGSERTVVELDFRLRIKNQLTPDDYEDIIHCLENIRDLLEEGLMELLGKTHDETKYILAKMQCRTAWPGSANIMIQAPPIVLSVLYDTLFKSDGGIPIGKRKGGEEVRMMRMDPVFGILPPSQEIAKKLIEPLIKSYEIWPQDADLYVIGHGGVGMLIPNTMENACSSFQEKSSWKVGDKLPSVYRSDIDPRVDVATMNPIKQSLAPMMTPESLIPSSKPESKKPKREEETASSNKKQKQQDYSDKQKAAILDRVHANGILLRDVPAAFQADKDVVLMACQQDGEALLYASAKLKAERDVVLTACQQNGRALEFASSELKSDKRIVLAACRQNGHALRFASDKLKADKDIVITAAASNPNALKFAAGGLNQDRDCLVAAKIWGGSYSEPAQMNGRPRIVLSTRFALEPNRKSQAIFFLRLLMQNEYIQKHFEIYAPMLYTMGSCDPQWSRHDWPCRGTFDTCRNNPSLKVGKPHSASCWRYAFRYELARAKESKGFMVQLVEREESYTTKHESKGFMVPLDGREESYSTKHSPGTSRQRLSKSQRIETDMANDTGIKIFRVHSPEERDVVVKPFAPEHIELVVSKLREWYDSGCTDTSDCVMGFERDHHGKAILVGRTEREDRKK